MRFSSQTLIVLVCALWARVLTGHEPVNDRGNSPAPNTSVSPDTPIAEILCAVNKKQLDEKELRILLPRLVDAYEQTHQNRYLFALQKLYRVNSKAVDAVLPRFAHIIRDFSEHNISGEAELCDLLDMFVEFDRLPVEVEQGIAAYFKRLGRKEIFANSKAAAVLLKFKPDRYGARAWLEESLSHQKRSVRLTAAAAFVSVGKQGIQSVPHLKKLLSDDSTSVRVAAATSIWRIQKEKTVVLPILLKSLQDDAESYVIKPVGVSDTGYSHRHVAASALGEMDLRKSQVEQYLLPLLVRVPKLQSCCQTP